MINMTKISEFILTNTNMAYLTAAFTFIVAAIFTLSYLVKFNYYKRHKRVWTGLKFNTKNLTYIAMMVAVSVTLTVVISVTIPITVFPPIRVAFSGIMVKITGMFFGPIVGLLVGLISELLCLLFVPSYIHIAYFCLALSFGFWSGITSYTIKLKGFKTIWIFMLINIYMVGFTAVMFFLQQTSGSGFDTKFFGISIPKELTSSFFVIMMGITLSMIWLVLIILILFKKTHLFYTVLPIFLLCIVNETLSTILIASWGDSEILGIPSKNGGYISMVILRLFQMPFKVAFNAAILTTVYMVMKPILKQGV